MDTQKCIRVIDIPSRELADIIDATCHLAVLRKDGKAQAVAYQPHASVNKELRNQYEREDYITWQDFSSDSIFLAYTKKNNIPITFLASTTAENDVTLFLEYARQRNYQSLVMLVNGEDHHRFKAFLTQQQEYEVV